MLKVERTECTGCTACAAICPKKCLKMQEDAEGFLFPVMDNMAGCIKCDLCNQICPVLHPRHLPDEITRAYAAYSQNTKERLESSSGGAFSLFAHDILTKGGIVYGAVYDHDFRVQHIAVTELEDLNRLRGAKYAQSDIDGVFSDVQEKLKEGRDVLFSGMPCQVSGLKAFLKRDYENLLTVDFVCHGIPSPMAWRAYVKYRAGHDSKGAPPKSINLRAKCTGWSHYTYSVLFEYADGAKYAEQSGNDLFMQLFVGDYINRNACESCRFKGYKRQSDVTLGDFWGIWEIDPEMDDNKGTSLILTHSPKGERVLEMVCDRMVVKEVPLEATSRFNPSLVVASSGRKERSAVFTRICVGDFDSLFSLFAPSGRASHVKNKIKRVLKSLGRGNV